MSYLWSNNSTPTGPANNGVPAGDYVITVTDDQGCSAADFITITEPTELTLSLTHTNVSCFGFNDGIIEAVADNGTPFLGIPPEYLYTVTDVNGVVIYSQTKPIGLAEGLTPGIYEVSAEDMNGCKIESGTIYISEPGDSLSITFNTVDASIFKVRCPLLQPALVLSNYQKQDGRR